jgi:hypothetical protein
MQQSNVARQRADGTSPDTRAKVAPKLAVPDWIVLIRKLRDEGSTDEAAKELAAFRAAYPDHERLLPPDLRDWKPAPRQINVRSNFLIGAGNAAASASSRVSHRSPGDSARGGHDRTAMRWGRIVNR